jgi:5-amino-6-(5-phosphoribosylamino)uracil reductase
MELRRLVPDPATLELAEAYTGLDLAARAPAGRPWMGSNFIATADGRATWSGKSGGLGGPADKEIFARLRCSVDAILAGSQTVRVERYGRLVDDPQRRADRVRQGLEPDPTAVLITRTGDLPLEAPLFADPAQPIIAYGPLTMADPPGEAPVTVVRMEEVDPRAIAADLRDRGIRSVMCEGGPTLFSGLVRARVVDEMFLTISPSLAGGGGAPTITTGMPLEELQQLRIESIHEHDEFLFLRYRLR